MTSLWRNVSVNVVANSNWSCLLVSTPKFHWRVQLTAARWNGRFSKMHGALHTLHVSLNNASKRTVHKCLKRNNGHLITLNSVDNVMKLSICVDNWMSNKCVKFYIIPLCSSWKISKILQGMLFFGTPGRWLQMMALCLTATDSHSGVHSFAQWMVQKVLEFHPFHWLKVNPFLQKKITQNIPHR